MDRRIRRSRPAAITAATEALSKVADHAAVGGHHELVYHLTGLSLELAHTDARRGSTKVVQAAVQAAARAAVKAKWEAVKAMIN